MIRTIARYGARHVSGSMLAALKAVFRGDGLRGSSIQEFEKQFAAYHGMQHALSASYGRMAFYYTLKALDLPRDSEIIFPALTFWAVPEMARVLGFRPKFVDIDPGKHVDICNVLNHFDPFKTKCPVAEATEHTLQLPVYASLTEKDLDRIIKVVAGFSPRLDFLLNAG